MTTTIEGVFVELTGALARSGISAASFAELSDDQSENTHRAMGRHMREVGKLYALSAANVATRADQAARDPRKKKTELISDAHQRTRIGQIEDASATAEYDDLLHQEADLTAGHGVLRTTGLICVTAPTVDELDAAVASIEQAAIQTSCETRRLEGQQAQAFTAAVLPLCRSV